MGEEFEEYSKNEKNRRVLENKSHKNLKEFLLDSLGHEMNLTQAITVERKTTLMQVVTVERENSFRVDSCNRKRKCEGKRKRLRIEKTSFIK